MRTKSIFRLTALAVLAGGAMTGSLLTSCSNDELIPEAIPNENFPEDGRVRISTSVEAPASSVITRAGGDEATSPSAYNGTTLGLFVDYTTPAGTTPEDPYTRFNVKWTQTTDASGNGTGTWTQDTTTPMLWKNSSSTATIWAYAPYQTAKMPDGFGIDVNRSVLFTIPTDQTGGIEGADLVSAKLTDFNPYTELNAKNAIDLTLKHRLTKFTVALTLGTQFDGEKGTDGKPIAVSSMTLYDKVLSAGLIMGDDYEVYALARGVIAIQMHPTTVTDGVAPDATATLPAFEAICAPASNFWQIGFKLLSLTLNNGKTYSYTVSAEVANAIKTAETNKTLYGHAFRLNLKVGKDKLEIADGADAITVVDWDNGNGTDNELPGGEAMAQISVSGSTITMRSSGILTDDILTQAIGSGNKISIVGSMNDADFEILRDWAIAKNWTEPPLKLKNLDLSGVTGLTKLPDNAFINSNAQTVELETVKLPASITTIGNYAFSSCSTLTTINLSAVTTIGDEAFAECSNLKDINLSQVTAIGAAGFSGCSSLGVIDAPKLTTLTNSVFNGCGTVSRINLPAVTGAVDKLGYLTTASLASITVLSGGEINLPSCTKLGNSMFDDMFASGATLNLTAAGNFTMEIYAFDHTFTSAPALVLNKDKKADGGAIPTVEGNAWGYYKGYFQYDGWASISYVDNEGKEVK